MYEPRRCGDANCFAQEGRLLGDSLDEMDAGARRPGHGTGEDDAGKAAAAAEVGPALGRRGEIDELKRVGDVPGPELRQGRGRDQIGLGLPLPEQRDVAIEPFLGFT